MWREIADWYFTHADVMAWTVGWVAALGAAQMVKQYLDAGMSETQVRRILHAVAVVTGSGIALALWPVNGAPALAFALTAGLSAPPTYTLIKALVAWKAPELAHRLSWDRIRACRPRVDK